MIKKTLLCAFLSCALISTAQDYSRAKIFTNTDGLQRLAEMGIAVDHGIKKQDAFFISDFSKTEIDQMRSAGYVVEILIEDVQKHYNNQNKIPLESTKNVNCPPQSGSTFVPEIPANFNLGTMAGFYTYQEFLDEVDAMAAQYPNLISARAPISTFLTFENRPIYFIRLSDNPNSEEAEPQVLYSSIHHAREPNSLSQTIFYMWYLLENYATNDEVRFLVDNTELYFVPVLNPDGYIYNETTNPSGGGLWRKNRRNNGDGTFGVDLNRNYSYGWGTTGVSMSTSGETYPGTGAFSEPETQAMKWLCENHTFLYASNAHAYANDLLHPIGVTAAEFAVDHDYFQLYTNYMVQYNGFGNIKSSDLYPASGDSDDYMYQSDLTIKPKIFAITPEVGSDADGFWPPISSITTTGQDLVFPNIMQAHLTHRYLEVKDSDPSAITTFSGNFNHSALRLGLEDGAVTVSIEPLTGILTVGASVVHTLALSGTANGAISYNLNPTIQFGDPIRYILKTEYVSWTKRDTITKTFGLPTSQILDEANTSTNWTGLWNLTNSTFVSPSQSFTDSPTGNYFSNTTEIYTFNQSVNLTNATQAAVRFYAKWALETDYDYTQFQISTDNGQSWIGQCGLYTTLGTSANGSVQPQSDPIYEGNQSTWVLEEINLSDYLGSTIQMRYILEADGGVQEDGFYFDDFEVLYNLSSAGLSSNESTVAHIVPNPANTVVSVNFDELIQEGLVSVYGLNGELIEQKQISEQTNKVQFDSKNWAEGLYTICVEQAGQFYSPMKLVVIH